MKKTIALFINLLFIAVLTLSAQKNGSIIKGNVITTDNAPAIAVTIHIKGTNRFALTDAKGNFVLRHISPGNYIIVASCTGCETIEKSITVTASEMNFISFKLDSYNEKLNDVVVTGQYVAQSLSKSVYRIRVISHEMIKLRNATDVLGVLNSELGVRFSTDLTLGETDIQLMGMSGENVKVLLDGVPLIDRDATKQSLSQIDIHSIDRIEIVEGPMSVVYGTDALAGVINIITKKGLTDEAQLSVDAHIQEESIGKAYNAFKDEGIHNENMHVAWQQKNWYANGSITRNNMGGWQGQETGRAKEWMPKNQWLAGGTVGYHNGKINVWYRLNYLNEILHSLGNVNPITFNAADQDYTTNRFTHQAQLDWHLNEKWSFNSAASYQNYNRATQTTKVNTQTHYRYLSSDAGAQDTSGFNSLFFRSTTQYLVSPSVSIQPGVEFQCESASGQRIEGSPVISNYSFFISSELKPIKSINIRPGFRLSKNSTYKAPPIIPSLNTMFSLNNNLRLRLAYARGFRAPALRELYFTFFDANHSIKGNENLKAEYSNSFNGSLSWESPFANDLSVSSTVAGFYNQFNNRIDLAIGVDAANPNVYTYINISKYKTIGCTWENTFKWKHLSATLGFLYIGRYNQYADDTAYSLHLPQYNWSPEINGNVIYNFKKPELSIAVFYKYTGKLPQYEVGQNDEIHLAKTAAFSWADVNINKAFNKNLSVGASVKNIFNVTRLQNTSVNVGGAHSTGGPVAMSYGRSYFISLNIGWAKKN